MIPDIGLLYDILVSRLILIGICSLRLLVILFVFPPAADGILQGRVRAGIAILFGSYIAYGQQRLLVTSLAGVHLLEIVSCEAIVGLVIGFSASTVFWIAQASGTYIDDLAGYNHVQMVNPLSHEQATPCSTLFLQIASVVFWTLGGIFFLLDVLFESYTWWPLAAHTPVATSVLESFVLQRTDTLMVTTAKLATPPMFLLLLVDLAFGFASKSAQKLDLVPLNQSVKGAVTMLMLAMFAGVFLDQMHGQLTLSHLGAALRTILH